MNSSNPLLHRLDQLNRIGVGLSRERNINRLLEDILLAAKGITGADGGTLYRMDDSGSHLRFEIMHTNSLGLALGGTTGKRIDLPDLPLRNAAGEPNLNLVAAYAALKEETVNIADAYDEAGFDFSGTRRFDAQTGYRSRSFLTVPMKNHEEQVIGVLQLINATNLLTGEVTRFSAEDQHLVESLASQAAIALTNRQLIDQLEQLFESFIGLINLAIDEKSHYTGGHCQRVPILTMLLAEAVNATREGPLADFHMSDKDRYELKIAGLLHDKLVLRDAHGPCGGDQGIGGTCLGPRRMEQHELLPRCLGDARRQHEFVLGARPDQGRDRPGALRDPRRQQEHGGRAADGGPPGPREGAQHMRGRTAWRAQHHDVGLAGEGRDGCGRVATQHLHPVRDAEARGLGLQRRPQSATGGLQISLDSGNRQRRPLMHRKTQFPCKWKTRQAPQGLVLDKDSQQIQAQQAGQFRDCGHDERIIADVAQIEQQAPVSIDIARLAVHDAPARPHIRGMTTCGQARIRWPGRSVISGPPPRLPDCLPPCAEARRTA